MKKKDTLHVLKQPDYFDRASDCCCYFSSSCYPAWQHVFNTYGGSYAFGK